MDETQALRTLLRIEKLLEQSLLSSKAERPQSEQRRLPGGKGSKQTDSGDSEKTTIIATKAIKDLAFEADKLGKSFRGVRTDVIGMRKGLRALGSSFSSMVSRPDREKLGDVAKGTVRDVDDFAGELNRGVIESTSTIKNAARDVDDFAGTLDGLGRDVDDFAGIIDFAGRDVDDFAGTLDEAGRDVDDFAGQAEDTRLTLKDFGLELRDVLRILGAAFAQVGKDIFYLQARGVSAASSLAGLYGDAITAGMSLQEYTEMMEDNQAAVVRARNFSDFGDSIDKTTKDLAKLGTFGPAAEKLAASMQTNSVMLGIPMEKQADATAAQVKQFEKLRKTTMMTASAFEELMKDVASNENVQEELLGLAPADRAARQQQLIDTATLGQQMGLTKEASKGLTDALLAQRKATAQQRFQAAGLIRQAGAIAGMGSEETEELARLARKKNKTADENKRFTELSGKLESRLQAMQNTGNIQAEFIGEQLSEKLAGTPYGEAQKQAGKAKLQTDAGEVKNEEIGKETGGFLQTVGKGLAVLTGFAKNPLGEAAIEIGGIAAQTAIQSMWFAKILAAIKGKGIGAATGMMDLLKGGMTKVTGFFTGILGKFTAFASSVSSMFSGGFLTTIATWGKAALSGFSTFFGSLGAIFKGILGALRIFTVAAAPVVAVIGGIVSAIEEIFTGEMTSALDLGEGIFGKLIGVVIAGFNGIFTGFTRLFDWGVNSIFEALGISFKVNLTKGVDYVTSLITDFGKMLGAIFLKVLANILESLPFVSKENSWVKALRSQASELDDSIDKGAKTREELWNTEGATLRKIGEKNIKSLEDEKKKGEVLRKQERVTTLNELPSAARTTVSAVQATSAKQEPVKKEEKPVQATSAKQEPVKKEEKPVQATPTKQEPVQATPTKQEPVQVAMPQPVKQQTVTPPEVNKKLVEAEQKLAGKEGETGAQNTTQTDLLTVAQQQLDVLKQTLAVLSVKETPEEPMEAMLKSLNRPEFTSSEKMWNYTTTGYA